MFTDLQYWVTDQLCHPVVNISSLGHNVEKYSAQKQPFYSHYTGTTCVSIHPQSRTGQLCWSKVLLPACPCWWHLVHFRVLLSRVTYMVSVPLQKQLRSSVRKTFGRVDAMRRDGYRLMKLRYPNNAFWHWLQTTEHIVRPGQCDRDGTAVHFQYSRLTQKYHLVISWGS